MNQPRWVAASLGVCTLLVGSGVAGAQDAQKAAAFKQAIADTRRAMSERELDAAKQHVKVASDNAQTEEQLDEVVRLESLLDYLGQFWDLLDKGVAKLQGGNELVVGKTRVAFVEAREGEIVVKHEGQLQRFTMKALPTPLVMALAEVSLAKDAVSKVVVGAFLAVDAKGDRKAARGLWDDALKAGLPIAHLLPELTTAAATDKLPVPTDDVKLKVAESQVHQEYRHLYSLVGIPVRQEELMRRLLADAPQVADNPEKRFVMLRNVRDMAAAAGNLRMTSQAIDLLDRFYQVDVVAMKLDLLTKLAETARGVDFSRQLVLQTLHLAEDAVQAGRLDEALAAAEIAAKAARKTRNRALVQQAAIAKHDIEMRRKKRGEKRR